MKPTLSPVREIAQIAVPVSIEFVLLLVLNFVTQVIVGGKGAVAIAAVGFANNLTFIANITISALGLSVSILAARAYGSAKRHELDTTVVSALMLGGGVAAVLAAVMAIWPSTILQLTGASPTVAVAATEYLRLSGLAVVPFVLVAILAGVMRSTGRPRPPLIATAISGVLTAALTYVLVYGVGPAPELGVAGAGWAVLVAALVRLAILLPQAVGSSFAWETPSRDELRAVLKPLFVLAIPLGITDLAWSTGTFLYSVVFQRLSDDALAASQIVATLEAAFFMASIGLISATNALVGRSIGSGDGDAARAWVRRILRVGRWSGIVFGALFATSIFALGAMFENAGLEVQHIAMIGILINAPFQWLRVANAVMGAGVMPSGNDVRGVILGDVVGAFVVGLPLAVGLGLFTPLGYVGIFAARNIEEFAKFLIFRARTRRVDWAKLAHAHT